MNVKDSDAFRVELLSCMGNDLTVVNAARVSFAKRHDELADNDERLLRYLAKNGHWTPFAHCMASFRISAPIYVARQLFKHKVGLVENEISRRYVDDEPVFALPTVWRKRATNKKQGSSNEEVRYVSFDGELCSIDAAVDHALWTVGLLYGQLIKAGVAPEQARVVLPLATMTEWIWTGSLVAFSRVCRLRLGEDAQLETKRIVTEISMALHAAFPKSWGVLRLPDDLL